MRDLATGLCDRLPDTHAMGLDDDDKFWMLPNTATSPSDDLGTTDAAVAAAVKQSCVTWLHDEHTVEHLADLIYQHMQHGHDATHTDAAMRHGLFMAHCLVAACQPPGTYVKGSHRRRYLDAVDKEPPEDL